MACAGMLVARAEREPRVGVEPSELLTSERVMAPGLGLTGGTGGRYRSAESLCYRVAAPTNSSHGPIKPSAPSNSASASPASCQAALRPARHAS